MTAHFDPFDPFDLARFVAAQDDGDVYPRALREIEAGRKVTHWMWFVFPQLAGLGSSSMARRYAVSGVDEARAYLAHPVLGARLRACTAAAAAIEAGGIERAFGSIDTIKLRSSMTLFEAAAPSETTFTSVLDRHFYETRDTRTLELLARDGGLAQRPEPSG